MCFSAQASFTAAAVIGAVGVASVIKAKPRFKALAFIPILFAIQQAVEGIVWVTLLSGETNSLLHKVSIYIFLIFATMLWPVWVPSVLYKIEENQYRKKWLKINIWIGVFIAIISGLGLIFLKHIAVETDHHISYNYIGSPFPFLPHELVNFIYYILFTLYVFPTVASWFISTLRGGWILGVILALEWLASIIAFLVAFGSVWCFFAAVASIVIFFIV